MHECCTTEGHVVWQKHALPQKFRKIQHPYLLKPWHHYCAQSCSYARMGPSHACIIDFNIQQYIPCLLYSQNSWVKYLIVWQCMSLEWPMHGSSAAASTVSLQFIRYTLSYPGYMIRFVMQSSLLPPVN